MITHLVLGEDVIIMGNAIEELACDRPSLRVGLRVESKVAEDHRCSGFLECPSQIVDVSVGLRRISRGLRR